MSMGVYEEAWRWIEQNPGTSGASGLAKLVLSLYNSNCGFAFSECVAVLDDNLTNLSIRMATEYARLGETEELRQVGKLVAEQYDRLWLQGEAMRDVRYQLRRKWELEDEEESKRLYPNG